MKYTIELDEEELGILLMGLRYLELNHPIKPTKGSGNHQVNYRKQFSNLWNNIYLQVRQGHLFRDKEADKEPQPVISGT